MTPDLVPTPSRERASQTTDLMFLLVTALSTPSSILMATPSHTLHHAGTGSHPPLPATFSDLTTPSHPVPTPSRTRSHDPVPRPPFYRGTGTRDGLGRRMPRLLTEENPTPEPPDHDLYQLDLAALAN